MLKKIGCTHGHNAVQRNSLQAVYGHDKTIRHLYKTLMFRHGDKIQRIPYAPRKVCECCVMHATAANQARTRNKIFLGAFFCNTRVNHEIKYIHKGNSIPL
jgi:hypothetical protein